MKTEDITILNRIPYNNLILLISGVPGMGKTTISYELLKNYNQFRIIEETDIVREVLRGYNNYLKITFGKEINYMLDKIYISDHTKLLTFEEAKEQCTFMKQSLLEIITRQQRKGISTIINGVHIIPEVLNDFINKDNIVFINLYVTNEHKIYDRIYQRDPNSYMLDNIPLIYQTNHDLYLSTEKIALGSHNIFNIDVTDLRINETVKKIVDNINQIGELFHN